jgi:excisionase family DNA binding protein
MTEGRKENIIEMLTIKEAAALVEGLTEYRVRQMCINDQIPHIMARKKYLINKEMFRDHLRGKTA